MVVLFSHIEQDEPKDPNDYRVRNFPQDKPLGKIDFYSPDSMFYITSSGSGVLAQGQVRFPNGMESDLEIFASACGDLSGLSCLEPDDLGTISFNECQIEDFQLKHLQHLTGLKCLSLKNTNVSEFGLYFLQGLNKLTTINLSKTPTNDRGLGYLPLNLRNVYLAGTAISNEGVAILSQLPKLRNICLPDRINDAGIAYLVGTQLEDLDLTCCSLITKACFKHFEQMPDLRCLALPAHIGDDDLDLLSNLKLVSLQFPPGTNTTDEGRKRMQSAGITKESLICQRVQ